VDNPALCHANVLEQLEGSPVSRGRCYAGPGVALALFTNSLLAVAACAPSIEEQLSGVSATLRPHANAFEACLVDETTYRRLISQWLAQRPRSGAELSSLSLGRAVTFPWISRHIADGALQSPGWAASMARVMAGERHRLAELLFGDPLLLERLTAPFEGTPYPVLGLGHEKTLFGRADAHATHAEDGAVLVPFDAQLWLRLALRD